MSLLLLFQLDLYRTDTLRASATGVGSLGGSPGLTHFLAGSPVGVGNASAGVSLTKPLVASPTGVGVLGAPSGFFDEHFLSGALLGIGNLSGVLAAGIYPANPSWAVAEPGYAWEAAASVAQATASYGGNFVVSASPSAKLLYVLSGFTVSTLSFGFVPSTSPQTTQPTNWYQGSPIFLTTSQYLGTVQIGAPGCFSPADGTTWWVWLSVNGTPIQAGQLFVD